MKRDIDKFHLMKVFCAVAKRGSFTKAAHALGMTVSSVSKAVQQLEGSLNTKLLYRTTRSQSLTDSGKKYFLYAQRILADLQDVESQIQREGDEPVGTLRVAAPTSVGQFLLGSQIHRFIRDYPQVNIDLMLSDKVADMTEEGIDVAIRSAKAPEMSPAYSKRLGTHTRRLVASPCYLASVKPVETPKQLAQMRLLNYSNSQVSGYWSFFKDTETVTVEPQAHYLSNNYYALHQAACNGVGIANLYQYLVDEDIKNGKLIHLLPDWKQQERELFAVYQQRRQASPKIDKFLDFLTGLF